MSKHCDKSAIELFGAVTVGPKGQVVVPVGAREKMGIQPGDKLVVIYNPYKKALVMLSQSVAQPWVDHMAENTINNLDTTES